MTYFQIRIHGVHQEHQDEQDHQKRQHGQDLYDGEQYRDVLHRLQDFEAGAYERRDLLEGGIDFTRVRYAHLEKGVRDWARFD